jgi:hypothetical protein
MPDTGYAEPSRLEDTKSGVGAWPQSLRLAALRSASIPGATAKLPALRHLLAVLFLVAFAALCVATLHPQQTWVAGDFALYIMHARNMVAGAPYALTGYIHNPANALISPSAYPPGLPMLLALPCALAGLDLVAMKWVIVGALTSLVLLVCLLGRLTLRPPFAWLWMGAVAFLPGLFERRDRILSDIPFTAWCYLALLANELGARGRPGMAWLLAAAVGMAGATRSAAIALVAALLLANALGRAPGWQGRMAATLAGAGSAAVLARVLGADASGTYLGYFSRFGTGGLAGWLADTLRIYAVGLSEGLGLSLGAPANAAALAVVLGLCGIGWLVAARQRFSAVEAFLPIYALLLLVFPVRFEPTRYALPVLPLLVFYPLRLAQEWARERIAFTAAALAIAACIVPYYFVHDITAPYAPAIDDGPSREMVGFIRTHVPQDSVILAGNPRVLALLTDRRAAIWPAGVDAAALRSYAQAIGARYVLLRTGDSDGDSRAVAGLLRSGPMQATSVFQNAAFEVFRYNP